MVWQTLIRHKKTNRRDNNLTSSSPSSLSQVPPSTSTTRLSKSSTTNHSQNESNKRSPSPQPPPRFHQPTSGSSTRSFSHNTDSNTSNHDTLPFSMTPAGQFFTKFFSDTMQHFNYPMHDIIWNNEPPTINSCIGNSANEKIIDNNEIISIEIDLSNFHADELMVNYNEEEREILIEGHHREQNDRYDSIERNFERNFKIPADTHDGSLAAYLTPSGLLTIQAFKKSNKQPVRRIPIQNVVAVPDSDDKNAVKIQPSETKENTTNKTNISSSVTTKPKNISQLKPCTPDKMSKVTGKSAKIEKLKKDEEKESNRTTDQLARNQEYLNIFC